jgi:hypothetical protein
MKKYSESTLHILSSGYIGNNQPQNNCDGCSKKYSCTKQMDKIISIENCEDEDVEPMIPPGAETWKKPEERFQPIREYTPDSDTDEIEPLMIPDNLK